MTRKTQFQLEKQLENATEEDKTNRTVGSGARPYVLPIAM